MEQKDFKYKINKTFYIDKFVVIPEKNDSNRVQTKYFIGGLDIQILRLLEHVNYSTNHDIEGISPFQIIYDILGKINMEYVKLPYDTDQKIQFISGKNMEALDIIDYCLHRSISKKTPPTYYMTQL